MTKIIKLAEQHILESQSRLRHIDEMMGRLKRAKVKADDAANVAAQLVEIQRDRDRAEQELLGMRKQQENDSSDSTQQGEQVKSTLELVGKQLERILSSLVESGVRE